MIPQKSQINPNLIGFGPLIDNLYMLDVFWSYNEILQTNWYGTKQKLNENSTTLWHKCLGHISKQRIQRLVSDEILEPLDLFETFVVLSFRQNLISISSLDKFGFLVHLEIIKLVSTKIQIWLVLVLWLIIYIC